MARPRKVAADMAIESKKEITDNPLCGSIAPDNVGCFLEAPGAMARHTWQQNAMGRKIHDAKNQIGY